jgi:hypothetical protein
MTGQVLEHNISKKIPKKQFVVEGFSDSSEVFEEIEKIRSSKESVYHFSSGLEAKFLYERSCVNDLSFNCFQIYNEKIYHGFKTIKNMMEEICSFHKLDLTKNKYYLTSELLQEFLDEYQYDFGGIRVPVFGGYWILESNNGSIVIDEEEIEVVPGKIVLFEAGRKFYFKNISKAISFNISTLNKIKNQYPQKWMPI